jgi:hypothetical protein
MKGGSEWIDFCYKNLVALKNHHVATTQNLVRYLYAYGNAISSVATSYEHIAMTQIALRYPVTI